MQRYLHSKEGAAFDSEAASILTAVLSQSNVCKLIERFSHGLGPRPDFMHGCELNHEVDHRPSGTARLAILSPGHLWHQASRRRQATICFFSSLPDA
jgi:hypothetical protein